MNEEVKDRDFVLRFVNKKSTERVAELVEKIRHLTPVATEEADAAPRELMDKFDLNPDLLLEIPNIEELAAGNKPEPVTRARLASLKPFIFPYYPPTKPNSCNEREFAQAKREFLTQSRDEHHRLLTSFQDRLLRDLCCADDQFQLSPFQIATTQLANEQLLPIHQFEKRKENLQTRFNSLIKKSQKRTAQVLDSEKRMAKIIQEKFQFDVISKNIKIEPHEIEQILEMPVVCPFSFLCDTGTSK